MGLAPCMESDTDTEKENGNKNPETDRNMMQSEKNTLADILGIQTEDGNEKPPPLPFSHKKFLRNLPPVPILKGKKYRKYPALWLHKSNVDTNILESFRTLKNKIVTMGGKNELKIIQLTGVERKVGTSTIAANLATIMARDMPEKMILLVDTSVLNPCLHLCFCLDQNPGLMSYLLKKCSLNDIIRNTFLPNLEIVTFSMIDRTVSSPFDQATFPRFLTRIRQYYDYILLDSGPVLRSSHSRIISSIADGVLVVAEANRTRFEVTNKAIDQLKDDNAFLIGSFLNKRRFVIPNWIYRFT